jgi:hypothetical protein
MTNAIGAGKMAREEEDDLELEDLEDDALDEALDKDAKAPKYGDGGNLELWDDEPNT